MLVALASAGAFAVAAVWQQSAAAAQPTDRAMSVRILWDLVRKPVWVAGTAASAVGFILQGVALAFGSLSLVQPLIVLSLAFAMPLAAWQQQRRLGRREWIATLAICAGLAAFLTPANPSDHWGNPSFAVWSLVFVAAGGLVLVCYLLARQAGPTARATLLALGAGVSFGLLDAIEKSITHSLAHVGLWGTMATWQPYVLTLVVVIGETLAQSAYQAGPLAAALPILDTLEPSVAVVIGVTAFGETLNYSVGNLAIEAAGIAAVIAGIVALDRSPVIIAMQEYQTRRHRDASNHEVVEDEAACSSLGAD